MGMEVGGSDLPQVNGEANLKVHDKENGKVDVAEPIKFGSHGASDEQQAKGEANNAPANAVDEWPEAPQVHSFWCVKYRTLEDPSVKAKIEQTDKEIQKTNLRISQIIEQLKPKRAARSELMDELRSLSAENSQYSAAINEKRQEMKPLQDALGTLRGSSRSVGICSTEKELNDLIRSLEYRMQHESLSLKEEKQIVREIKELEATRPKVIANTAKRAKIQDALGQTDVIQDQVKLLGTDLDGVRKQKADLKARMDHLGSQVKAFDAQIKPLQEEFVTLNEKRDKAFKAIRELRKTRDDGNQCFYQNRDILNTARGLAAKKDLKALEELVETEVEKFMSQWNGSKTFRSDYEKRILMSLDMRQLSRDGRMRNPDEKPLVMVEPPRPSQPELGPKKQKEDPKTAPKPENLPAPKAEKEPKKNIKESKTTSQQADEEEEFFVVHKPKKVAPKDELKLKEMRREEEKEKQRQAIERKKKLQEKAAAKAALRAQKEAEKKQKALEKKLKKKEATSTPATTEEDPTEKEAEPADNEKSDNAEEAVEPAAPSSRSRELKDTSSLKSRRSAKKPLPKSILKKKKSTNYYIWGSAAAAAAVFVALVSVGYRYLL